MRYFLFPVSLVRGPRQHSNLHPLFSRHLPLSLTPHLPPSHALPSPPPLFCPGREFAKTIKRPFTVRYNPYTQSVDVLKDMPSINSVVEELRHELDIVGDALQRLNQHMAV